MPKMDYSKLLGRMAEKGYTRKSLAEAIHTNNSFLGEKLKGKRFFSSSEIVAICQTLGIENCEIGDYFFCKMS